jgi:RimJ/RimL family protein N-acetyltransferase
MKPSQNGGFFLMNIDIDLLKGEHVYLEFLLPEHIEELRSLAKDDRIWEFTKTLLVNDHYNQRFDDYIMLALDRNALEKQVAFIIRKKIDNTVIGMTRYYGIDEKNRRLNIGYTWYIPSVWGKVYNKECKLILLTYAFEQLDFNRVGFEVAHQNIRSQKAVTKIGAIKEGELRKHALRPDGAFRNTVVFSIINDEWPEKKKHLQQIITGSEK